MKENIDPNNLPQHIAVIMDGNGRWAKKQGAINRLFGHTNAIKAVREVTEGCAELGVKFLTLYAFSTENWSRPQEEVNGLMELLVATIRKEIKTLHDNNVRLSAIGDLHTLPVNCQKELQEAIQETSVNTGLTLVLALSYSGRSEITQAIKKIASEVQSGKLAPDAINEALVASYMQTVGMPDPELLIRTSGELRISNFLLWQIAYTEIFITEVLWPDFRKKDLIEAIQAYQKRERRFGKISEQLKN
ncbi:isoprenyl transferase [Cytophagales bacterium LB-30]|uniref:Isoprenyl transferase n=1 Tax=Shiella aurantiaca TaxID=3058365 RepID=A0ABT8F2Y8_9BACT|nr:isoprenyl transferase [Shiella aurantiaca]MDN4164591.1 isoprenyl transferase [Shiella aurantiaca]